MFTGLIAELGRLARSSAPRTAARLRIEAGAAAELGEGDSVAVNGVCLTATDVDGGGFSAEAMNETLARTSLGGLDRGRASTSSSRCGQATGSAATSSRAMSTASGRSRRAATDGFARRVRIERPDEVLRYVVEKGSIAVDGVSLTVAELDERSFTVSLIPETLERTNLGPRRRDQAVNLEVDVLAKYVEKAVNR